MLVGATVVRELRIRQAEAEASPPPKYRIPSLLEPLPSPPADSEDNESSVLSLIDQLEEDIRICQESINESYETADIWWYMGACLTELQRYDEALGAFAKALELDPSHLDSLRDRAWLYEKLGQWDKADQDYRRLQAIPGLKAKATGWRAEARIRRAKALSSSKKAMQG